MTVLDECDEGAHEAWLAEVARRSAEVDAGTAQTMTLDEYRARVRERRLARAKIKR